jgi:hypothetical protein
MGIVSHSKCTKCDKVRNVSELEENPSGVGMVCIDKEMCIELQSNNKVEES